MAILLSEAEARRRDEGVLLDTNLFVMLCVGDHDPTLIPYCNRTSNYKAGDYNSLRLFLDESPITITIPNVLTEVSNLLGQVRSPARSSVFEWFSRRVNALDEIHVPSRAVVIDSHLDTFGLTDLAIAELCRSRYLVLTDDSGLAAYLYKIEVAVLDFQRLRPIRR